MEDKMVKIIYRINFSFNLLIWEGEKTSRSHTFFQKKNLRTSIQPNDRVPAPFVPLLIHLSNQSSLNSALSKTCMKAPCNPPDWIKFMLLSLKQWICQKILFGNGCTLLFHICFFPSLTVVPFILFFFKYV